MEQVITRPSLGFSEALNTSTSKIFQVKGRSRRSEFWWTMLLVSILSVFLTPVFGLFLALVTIPLKFRRLHDTGRSGWWYGCFVILSLVYLGNMAYDFVMYFLHIDEWLYCLDEWFDYQDHVFTTILLKYGIWSIVLLLYELLLLAFYCMDSQMSKNKYGDSPKYRPVDDIPDA